jgi:hypothetical protein
MRLTKQILTTIAALTLLVTSMAAIRNTLIQNVNLNVEGSPYVYGPLNAQNNVSAITVELARRDWPEIEGPAVRIEVQLSTDNGQSWSFLLANELPGGIVRGVNGDVRTNSTLKVDLAPGNGRRLRAIVDAYTNILTDVTITTE